MQKLAQLLRSSVLPCSTAARCLRPSRRSDLMPLLRAPLSGVFKRTPQLDKSTNLMKPPTS
eukprot:1348163-Amphidinium_carterae.1